MSTLVWLAPHDPPEAFPPVEQALREPRGLLAVGGDLAPERLLYAYRQGIFPWYEAGQPILWWCPDPRAVLFADALHVSRRTRRMLRRQPFEYTLDTAFSAVVAACAAPRAHQQGTWITPEMKRAYRQLHELGWAHSLEVWQQGELVGGIYGVAIGRVFFGESMFSRVSNASKAALIRLIEHLGPRGLELLDCQMPSPHLQRLGAVEIPRRQFIALLDRHCEAAGVPGPWRLGAPSDKDQCP